VKGLRVCIQVDASVARALRKHDESNTEADEVRTRAEHLDLLVWPMHPDSEDASLIEFLMADVPDRETGERVVTELMKCRGVKGAYLKPADELP